MSGVTPSTPTPTMPLNRSFTLPTKIASSSSHNPNVEIGATEQIETLYVHPEGKIVKFITTSGSRPGSSIGASSSGRNDGTLSWTSLTENTLAAGPLELYRVPGSVAFLHSGSLLHAILPRSNCWCVDGVSKFAMRVLPDTYYRIELPSETPEDLEKVEELKAILKKVLFFERTPCPFARNFSVDLPEQPEVRKKRRKAHGPAKKWKLDKANSWRPEDGGEPPQAESDDDSGSASDEGSTTQDESAAEDNQSKSMAAGKSASRAGVKSGLSVKDRIRGLTAASRSCTAPSHSVVHELHPSRLRTSVLVDGAETQPGADEPTRQPVMQEIPTDMPPSPPDSSAGFDVPEIARTFGAEDESEDSVIIHDLNSAHLTSEVDTALHDLSEPELHPELVESEVQGVTGADIQAQEGAQQELGDAASFSDVDAEERSISVHKQSEAADSQTPRSNRTMSPDKTEQPSQTTSDPFAEIQARIQARRSIGGTPQFSPGIMRSTTWQSSSSSTSMSNSGRSSSSTRSAVSRRAPPQQALATALVKKACNVFLGPPAHLVVIMLRIAKRFANGTFGEIFSFDSPARSDRRKVPGSFDLDGSDVDDMSDPDDVDEDDFGVPLRSPIRLAARNEALSRMVSAGPDEGMRPRSGWEID